jgi:pantoate--beta-alanine ligase
VRIVSASSDVRSLVSLARGDGRTIGFVPTMGALHAGHASLIERAKSDGHLVVVSIFVNPLQFNDPRDLASYPKTTAADEALCDSAGVDLLWRPDIESIYPAGFDTRVEPGALADRLEGSHRPGHFTGVATVVLKLLNVVAADEAYFGRKDYQQLAVIRRMAADFDLVTRVVGCPTVREPDGLAMSSRNVKLDPSSRRSALALATALRVVVDALRAGSSTDAARARGLEILDATKGVLTEYLEIVDPRTLEPTQHGGDAVVLVAANVGGVRLIDNMEVSEGGKA